MKMGAVIYARVSTKEQTQNLSLSTQRRACEDYCRREGWEVARVFTEEGESAKTLDRTQIRSLVAYCRENKKRINFVVVHSLSRFSRDTRSHHVLRGLLLGLGIGLRSATEAIDDSPTGKLMETMLSGIAQFDNDVKAERTKSGMRAALESGRWAFQAPIGFRTGPRGGPSLVQDREQAALVLEAFEAVASARCSFHDLRERLRVRGFVTRHGGPLSAQTLRLLLRNPLYAGRVVIRKWGISVSGDFDAIVPLELFKRVQARLSGRGKGPVAYTRNHPDFPLRRFVRCGQCDRPLTGSRSRGRGGSYAYYHCARCGAVRVPKADLEAAFRDLLARLQPRPEFLPLFKAVVTDTWTERRKSSRETCAQLERQIATLRQQLDDLDEAFLHRKVIDQRTYERQRDRLREREALAEVDLAEAASEELDVKAILAFAEQVLADAARLWDQATLDQRVRLQQSFFPEGLRFDGSEFGTAVTCLAFTQLTETQLAENGLASPTRFELVLPP